VNESRVYSHTKGWYTYSSFRDVEVTKTITDKYNTKSGIVTLLSVQAKVSSSSGLTAIHDNTRSDALAEIWAVTDHLYRASRYSYILGT
jgi:hypothetical protein